MKVKQRVTQDQIVNFGQTPSQLLTVPHVKRMPLKDVLHMQVKAYVRDSELQSMLNLNTFKLDKHFEFLFRPYFGIRKR